MESIESFGPWLKARRRANDMTQVELARRVYCAEITIRKIEAGDLRPSRDLAALLVNTLEKIEADQHQLVRWARQR